jgi:hypothetical protein
MTVVYFRFNNDKNFRKQIEEMSAANTTLRTKLNVSETELRITKETLKSNEAIIHHLRMNRSSSAADLTQSTKKRHFPKFFLRKEEKLIKETNQPGQKDACRLLAVDDPLKSTILCATSISSEKTTDFSTFTHGICVLDIKTMTKEKYVATHKATIKDIEFNSGYLLTGSMVSGFGLVSRNEKRLASQPVYKEKGRRTGFSVPELFILTGFSGQAKLDRKAE